MPGPVNVEVPVVVKQLAALRGQHLHAHTLRILHTSGLNLPVGLFSKQNKKRGCVSKPRWSGQQRARADGKLRATYLALGQAQDGYHDDGRSGHCQHGTRHHRVVAPSSEQQKRR
jgi:hypothetical protein